MGGTGVIKIKTQGTAYERGKQQGSVCSDRILSWMHITLGQSGINIISESMQKEICILRQQMEKLYPEGYEEMCGIAAGLGINEDKYFFDIFCISRFYQNLQCTVLGFKTEDDNTPVLGKTDDISLGDIGCNLLELTFPDKGYKHVHFHYAGTIWSVAGMNECGLAMVMTGIPGPKTMEEGLSSLDALHAILPNLATVDEVKVYLNNIKLNCYGFSLLAADAQGGIVLIEKTGKGMCELLPESDNFFIHTNHILDTAFAALNPPQCEPLNSNSKKRYANTMKKIKLMSRRVESMEEFLNDRSKEGAIRQHGEDGLYTDFNVMLLPAERKLIYRSGYPQYDEVCTININELERSI